MSNATLPEGAYSMEGLLYYGGQHKYGHGKNFAIVTSVSAILSTAFSCLLVATILRSKDRMSTPYHRLLMGMAIGDILFSLPHCLFHAMVPTDMDWLIWGARGNQATCTLNGFVIRIGATLSLFYVCSLILYYLAKVKFSKTDMFIRRRLEPFFHGVPILTALAQGVIGLVNQNYNTTGAGVCTLAPIYNPGHCVGFEDGDIRPGFEIPCGRGSHEALYQWFSFIVFMIPPVVIVVAFAMIYGAVRRQEKTIGRYGASVLNTGSTANDPAIGASRTSGFQRMSSSISSVYKSVRVTVSGGSTESSSNTNGSHSRAVMHRAFAYIMAYFVTWIWAVVGEIMILAGVDIPLAYNYIWTILVPMQGLFNFLVYIHPKAKKVKKDENLSWPRAFAKAILTGLDIECTCMKKKRAAASSEKKDTETTAGINGNASSSAPTTSTVSSRRGTSRLDDSFVAEDEEAEIATALEDGSGSA